MANNELYHHGIKGQKWYVRRYQNEDGTLTEEGKRRYGKSDIEATADKVAKAVGGAMLAKEAGRMLESNIGSSQFLSLLDTLRDGQEMTKFIMHRANLSSKPASILANSNLDAINHGMSAAIKAFAGQFGMLTMGSISSLLPIAGKAIAAYNIGKTAIKVGAAAYRAGRDAWDRHKEKKANEENERTKK